MAQRRPNRVLGGPHDQFWAFCAADEFRMQRCERCLEVAWPPRDECERCGHRTFTWEILSGRGTVVSWCTLHQQYYQEIGTPWDVVLVELEEGPLFVSNPAGFDLEGLEPNTSVRVTFLDCEDEAGVFRLPVFEASP